MQHKMLVDLSSPVFVSQERVAPPPEEVPQMNTRVPLDIFSQSMGASDPVLASPLNDRVISSIKVPAESEDNHSQKPKSILHLREIDKHFQFFKELKIQQALDYLTRMLQSGKHCLDTAGLVHTADDIDGLYQALKFINPSIDLLINASKLHFINTAKIQVQNECEETVNKTYQKKLQNEQNQAKAQIDKNKYKFLRFLSSLGLYAYNSAIPDNEGNYLNVKTTRKVFKRGFDLLQDRETIIDTTFLKTRLNRWNRDLITPSLHVEIPENDQYIPRTNREDASDQFIEVLRQCPDLKTVEIMLKEQMIFLELPATIEKWRERIAKFKLQEFLKRQYHLATGQSPHSDETCLNSVLNKKKVAFQERTRIAKGVVEGIIDACNELELADILKKLKEAHISLEEVESPPQTKEEWLQKVQEESFKHHLATQLAKFAEARDAMVEKSMRICIIQKNKHADAFLSLERVEAWVGIAQTIISLASIFPLFGFMKGLAAIVDDLEVTGLSFICIFHPKFALNFLNLIVSLCRYGVGRTLSPHAYSAQGYKLELEKWTQALYYNYMSFRKAFHLFLLRMKIQFIESKILHSHDGDYQIDQRYIDVTEQLKIVTAERKHQIEELELRLRKLYADDAKANLSAPSGHDPFEIFAQSIAETDPRLISPELIDFFEQTTGIEIAQSSHLQQELEGFFIASPKSFIRKYEDRLRMQAQS